MESGPTYNAAADLIERNLASGRGAKIAIIDDRGQYSYAELAERVARFANVLRGLGLRREQRILLCLHDDDRFSERLSRRDQGRDRASRGQHPARPGRIRLHADATAGRARSSSRRRCCRRCGRRWRCCRSPSPRSSSPAPSLRSVRSPACWQRRRALPRPPRPIPTSPASGSIPRVRPDGPRAPSICNRAWSRPPSATRSRCSASPRAISCFRRPSCSSPMGSATR